jgi:predicted nuclease of predicted toxin-antitoxin system
MKFIVDAHFPRRLSKWLNVRGYDSIHTSDLPKGNNTTDIEIIEKSIEETRIVITKDSDFLKYRVVKGEPDNILMVITGKIINTELIKLFEENFKTITDFFESGKKVIELSNETVIVHS